MRKWKRGEEAVLRRFWTECTHRELSEMLPGRTVNAVRHRCNALGLTRSDEWTEEQVAMLRSWYEARDGKPLQLDDLARKLGRHKTNVSRKARSLGLSNRRRTTGRKDRRKFKGDERALRKHLSERQKKAIRRDGHPRGMLGKKKSPESVARSAKGSREWRARQPQDRLDEMSRRAVETKIERYGSAAPPGFMDGSSNPYSRTKAGRRADLGDRFFRSRWEANYARFLNLLVEQGDVLRWEYEADTFWFDGIKRGVRSYTPDFKVWDRDGSVYYVEVKGWMDAKSKTKLKRMKKYHPDVDLRLFGEKAYRELARKLGAAIPGWEGRC